MFSKKSKEIDNDSNKVRRARKVHPSRTAHEIFMDMKFYKTKKIH